MNKYCQSCGMPFAKDPQGGGSNADGSKSTDYCSHCFQSGSFTRPNFTVNDMQELCITKMVEMKFPKLLAWVFTRKLPKLKRWSKK